MASTQEIHHVPVQGQDFNIQDGHCLQPTNQPIFKHKPPKKCVTCEPVWKHKPSKKWSKHKLNKDECSSSSSSSSSSSIDACSCSSSSSSDSCSSSSSSDSSSSSSSSECGFDKETPELKPICKHKPPKECPIPGKCFESKHKLKKGKGKFVPGKKPNFGKSKGPKLDWKHKSKHFECDTSLECKFKHKKTGACTGNIQDCFDCEVPACPTNECLHFEGDVHKWFDCEDRFRRCLICKQELGNLTCECLEHSHFGLCALRIFLTRRCGFFGCHRLWSKPASKPWSKPGPDPCQSPKSKKF